MHNFEVEIHQFSNHQLCKYSKEFRKSNDFSYFKATLLLEALVERRSGISASQKQKHEKLLTYFTYEITSLIRLGVRFALGLGDEGGGGLELLKFVVVSMTLDPKSSNHLKVSQEFLKLNLKHQMLEMKSTIKSLAVEEDEENMKLFFTVKSLFLEARYYNESEIENIHVLASKFLDFTKCESKCLITFTKYFLQVAKTNLDDNWTVLLDCYVKGVRGSLSVLVLFAEILSGSLQNKKTTRSCLADGHLFISHTHSLLRQVSIMQELRGNAVKERLRGIQFLLQSLCTLQTTFSTSSKSLEAQLGADTSASLLQMLQKYLLEDDSLLFPPPLIQVMLTYLQILLKTVSGSIFAEFLKVLILLLNHMWLEAYRGDYESKFGRMIISNSILVIRIFQEIIGKSKNESKTIETLLDDIPAPVFDGLPLSFLLDAITSKESTAGEDDFFHTLLFIQILLESKKSRTALGDSKAFKYLLIENMVTLAQTKKQQDLSLLNLKILHLAAEDSSVRFKIKADSIHFFASLLSTFACDSSSFNQPYREMVLNICALFLNEWFGHDLETMHTLTVLHDFPHLVISILCERKGQLLDLQPIHSSQDHLVSLAHLLDSLLRTESAKKWLIHNSSNPLEKLVEISISIDVQVISSVLNKLLARVLSDVSMTIDLSSENCFFKVFHILMKDNAGSKELLLAIETRLQLCALDIIPVLANLYEYQHSKSHSLISIALVNPKDLLASLSSRGSHIMSRPFAKLILGKLIESYHTSDQVKLVIQYLGTKKSAATLGIRRNLDVDVDSLLIQGILSSPFDHSKFSFTSDDDDLLLLSFPEDTNRRLLFPRQVLLSASSPFKAMLDGSFSESKLGEVALHDATDRVWEILLSFLMAKETACSRSPVQFQDLALPSHEDISTMTDTLLVAQTFLIDGLKKACLQWLTTVTTVCSISRERTLISHIYCNFLKACQDETVPAFQTLRQHIIDMFFASL